MAEIRDLMIKVPSIRHLWLTFLAGHGLQDFPPAEVAGVDHVVGLYENDRLVGTGATAGNILKFIAVDASTPPGAYFNQIVSELQSRLAAAGQLHVMVSTKPQYEKSFHYVGFQTLVHTHWGVLMEAGTPTITQYLQGLSGATGTIGEHRSAIVMNANPFTKGHRYLVEQAAMQSDAVDIFVVSTDRSLFTTAERLHLVQTNTADLANVHVYLGGDYMVSYATFPAYFLASNDTIINYQTTIDARLFRDWVAKILHIQTRYVGEEPLSHTTAIYNQVLQKELPPQVQVKVIPRLKVGRTIVTATQVRSAIAQNKLSEIRSLLPAKTWKFIQIHQTELETRIKKGMTIRGN